MSDDGECPSRSCNLDLKTYMLVNEADRLQNAYMIVCAHGKLLPGWDVYGTQEL